jgi:hypothetical protein
MNRELRRYNQQHYHIKPLVSGLLNEVTVVRRPLGAPYLIQEHHIVFFDQVQQHAEAFAFAIVAVNEIIAAEFDARREETPAIIGR